MSPPPVAGAAMFVSGDGWSTEGDDGPTNILSGFMVGRLDAEWFWVFGYGTVSVLIVILNTLMLFSIGKNKFLHTNTHRCFAFLSLRNSLRAIFTLCLAYITRIKHPIRHWKDSNNNSFKAAMPTGCDVLCTIDAVLTTFPMFLLTAMAIHMFTRFPSPTTAAAAAAAHPAAADSCPHHRQEAIYYGGGVATPSGLMSGNKYSPTYHTNLLPKEPSWLGCLMLPSLPLVLSGLVSCPMALFHLSHALQVVPDKRICADDASHVTFDTSVFILAFCLPFLLTTFILLGLILRRCLRCSSGHCCNSWCKEEYVLASVFIATSLTQLLLYLPLIGSLIRDSFGPENGDWPPPFVTTKLGSTPLSLEVLTFPETARALEMAVAGLTLPIACYLTLPTYRQFCSEPDPDDLKNSTPKLHYNGAKKYKSSSKARGGQYHPDISIEGPIMTAPPAAPGAASMVSGGGGGPAAAAVVLTSSKRTSSNMDRDSQVFREEEEEGL